MVGEDRRNGAETMHRASMPFNTPKRRHARRVAGRA